MCGLLALQSAAAVAFPTHALAWLFLSHTESFLHGWQSTHLGVITGSGHLLKPSNNYSFVWDFAFHPAKAGFFIYLKCTLQQKLTDLYEFTF